MHSNSFLFGRFDGTGWFAQKVDQAAAAGVLWVNSAGNYRTRHWEGAWSDADADGNLDVPGDGNAFRVELPATAPAGLRHLVGRRHGRSRQLLPARALPGSRADDARARQGHAACAIRSDGLAALPDPHADMPPGAIAAAGVYYLSVRRVGTPPTTQLTLYCRMDLSPTAQVAASSSPTPGDARGAFSVGAFDATTLLPESYSSEGPTDDGRLKPDISAPTNVRITPGRSRVRGDQLLRRHVVRHPPRRRRRGAPVGVRSRPTAGPAASRSACATASSRRRSTWARRERTPSSAPAGCGSTSPRRSSARPRRRPTRSCAARSRSRCPSAMRARSACCSSRPTARRSWRRSRPAGSCRRPGRLQGLPPALTRSS